MALTRCSECKGKVSDTVSMCPHCGFGLRKNIENKLPAKKTAPAQRGIQDPASVPQTLDERRVHKRIHVRMMAKINNETARISNISKGGMKLITPLSHHAPNIDISLDNGEKVFHIKGILRWVSSKRSFSNLIDMGVEIFEAPAEYYEFIDQMLANQ